MNDELVGGAVNPC